MDPIANLKRQLELAERIIHYTDAGTCEIDDLLNDGAELAALVTALAEWRFKGGFDPYQYVKS